MLSRTLSSRTTSLMMSAHELRTTLGLSPREFARALNVNERTVQRWDDEEVEPSGAAAEILTGIRMALEDDGADVKRIKRRVSLGIATIVHRELRRRR